MPHDRRAGTLPFMATYAVRERPATPTAALFGARDGAGRADRRLRDARGVARPRLRRRGLVRRLAAVARLPDRAERGRRPRPDRPRAACCCSRSALLIGWSVATTVNYYAETDPSRVRQAFGATALSSPRSAPAGTRSPRPVVPLPDPVLAAARPARRRRGADLRAHPGRLHVWSLFGLALFSVYTVVDFNRLRRAGKNEAIPLAAAIFLDVLNIFLFFCGSSAAARDRPRGSGPLQRSSPRRTRSMIASMRRRASRCSSRRDTAGRRSRPTGRARRSRARGSAARLSR